ncbi:MAG: esterase, partial [Mesorhizobium sp.]
MAGDPSDPAGRGKYAALLDPELWDYIDTVNGWYPPEIAASPIAEQRAVYNRMCVAFHQGRPQGVSISDGLVATAAHTIPVRRYR